jgi:hypothetical protein
MRLIFLLFSYLLLIGVIMIAFSMTYGYYFDSDMLESQELRHLESVAQSKASRLDSFLSERVADAAFLVETEEVKRAFDEDVIEDVELLKDVARKVAEQAADGAEEYLLAHPEMTLEELQQDPEFKKIAIRRVGGEGYTVFYGTEAAVNYLHFKPEKTGEGHDHVWNSSVHAQLAKILRAAEQSEEDVSGFYRLLEREGEREKFMYVRMIPGRYFDDKVSVKSIIYIDEFGKTIKVASDFDKEIEDFQNGNEYLDIILIDPDGNVIWTAEQRNDLGTNLETGVYNDTNLARVYRVAKDEFGVGISEPGYYEASGVVSVFITSPVLEFDPETHRDVLKGIIALQLDNEKIEELVASEVGVGEFGEIYVINQDGGHITPLLLEKELHAEEYSHSVSSDQIERCFLDYYNYYISQQREVEQVDKSGTYENYAGVPVLGAHQYILQSGWCILAEVSEGDFVLDRFEKLDVVDKIVNYAIIVLVGILIILLFVFDYYYKLRGLDRR